MLLLLVLFLLLVSGSVAGLFTTSGSSARSFATFGSVASAGVGTRIGTLSKLFIGNNLLLKPLRTFSLALSNNTKLLY